MKTTRLTALAAVSLAAALSLTACGGDDSEADASSKGSSTSNSPTTSSPSSSSSSSSSNSDAKPGAGSGSGSSEQGDKQPGPGKGTEAGAGAGGGQADGAKVTFCKSQNLAIDAQDAAPDESSGRIDITMTNRGSTTCSATGFAGVDIKDADHTTTPIERGRAQPRVTTLEPGDTAVFNLAYEIDNSGESLTSPTHILITPPNETHSVTLQWPAGAGQIKGAYTDVQVYPTHTTK
ncbi:DUF4232 domain-containing protein [Streptomyces longispororuber]|uniref:DUF4232 domain-containing protein n=1 Tax=Streptomyces longispororuber TaxID=68230 RepID=UPI0033CE3BF4